MDLLKENDCVYYVGSLITCVENIGDIVGDFVSRSDGAVSLTDTLNAQGRIDYCFLVLLICDLSRKKKKKMYDCDCYEPHWPWCCLVCSVWRT